MKPTPRILEVLWTSQRNFSRQTSIPFVGSKPALDNEDIYLVVLDIPNNDITNIPGVKNQFKDDK